MKKNFDRLLLNESPDAVVATTVRGKVLYWSKGGEAVFGCSSSHEERDLIASYKLGVNSYVVKPMAFDPFSQSVRQLCEYWLGLNQPPKA